MLRSKRTPAPPPAAAPAATAPPSPSRLAFDAVSSAISDSSPLKQLFMRAADHDPALTEIDLTGDGEMVRWTAARQAAALELLSGSPTLSRLTLSGLALTDAVAPALAAVLAADGALQVLNLERNDLNETGLLQIIAALASNTTLRELRLTGQRHPCSNVVETALGEMLEEGGSSGLVKLGLHLRNNLARQRVDAALFRHMDVQRQLRAATRRGGAVSPVHITPAAAPPPPSTTGATVTTVTSSASDQSAAKNTATDAAGSTAGGTPATPRHRKGFVGLLCGVCKPRGGRKPRTLRSAEPAISGEMMHGSGADRSSSSAVLAPPASAPPTVHNAIAPATYTARSPVSIATSGNAAFFTQRLVASPAKVELTSDQRIAVDAFAAFIAARDAAGVQQAHTALVASLPAIRTQGMSGAAGHESLADVSATLGHLLPHRSRTLLHAVEARAGRPEYTIAPTSIARGGTINMRAVVVGAGPVGLRCAIELAMLGLKVDVLERRASFSRLQVLHLWSWVEHDLIDLGVKTIDPSIFAAADYKHVSTCQLQHSLLKIVLLLGVRVHFGVDLTKLNALGALLPTLEEETPHVAIATSAPLATASLHPHPLMPCFALPGHYCDVGNSNCGDDSNVPTAYRCAAGCDFDVVCDRRSSSKA